MNPVIISATKAKVCFGEFMDKAKHGQPIIVEKNGNTQIVLISIDDYEDFLELKDEKFQKKLNAAKRQIEKGQSGSIDTLYAIHRKTIIKEAN